MADPRITRAGWVLVGGRSSRMGLNKARAQLDGRALALRAADRVAAVCGMVSLVGDPAQYSDFGLTVVPDRFPGQGPLAGIEAALGATSCDSNLLLACDMPTVSKNLLDLLFDAGGDIAIPRHPGGKLEPLCAVYHRRCHPAILAALKSGVRKVTDVLPLLANSGFAIRYVRVANPAEFANLNTPEDWRRYHHG